MKPTTPHPDAPDERIVRDLRKNAREIARIQLRTYEGVRLVDIRAYALRDNDDPLPTKKGISLNVQLLHELIEALREAETAARQMGWLSSDSAKAA